MKFLDGSVHWHHIFYFVKLSHDLIILHLLAQIINRCHTNWYFTMDCTTEKFLLYVISDVRCINIILIIFIWYFRRSKSWISMNNKLPMWYFQILNGKWTHFFICIMICLLVDSSFVWQNLLSIMIMSCDSIINITYPRKSWIIRV